MTNVRQSVRAVTIEIKCLTGTIGRVDGIVWKTGALVLEYDMAYTLVSIGERKLKRVETRYLRLV